MTGSPKSKADSMANGRCLVACGVSAALCLGQGFGAVRGAVRHSAYLLTDLLDLLFISFFNFCNNRNKGKS